METVHPTFVHFRIKSMFNDDVAFDSLPCFFHQTLYMSKVQYVCGEHIISYKCAPKHRLFLLVRTASPRRFERVPKINVLIINVEHIKFFLMKYSTFNAENFFCIFHGQILAMEVLGSSLRC